MTPEQQAKLRLARTEGLGPVNFRRLIERFGSAERTIAEWPRFAREFGRSLPPEPFDAGEAARETESLAERGGRFLFVGEPFYPPRLAALIDPPPLLAVLGDPAALSADTIGIVGARNASANGRRFASALAAELAAEGLVVVSGMARGIDTAAHEGALGAGLTVASVAGGLDVPYPPENAVLQARIAERGGAVVSEAPLGTAPVSRHFPRRNRVIAGLSIGLVVIEAAHHSGSLITARLALEAGREIFAVPGSPLDPRCRGSNNLIREGAVLVETAADVLAGLPGRLAPPRRPRPGFAEGQTPLSRTPDDPRFRVTELVGWEPTELDDVLREARLPTKDVLATVGELECDGWLTALPGNRLVRV